MIATGQTPVSNLFANFIVIFPKVQIDRLHVSACAVRLRGFGRFRLDG
jgi:hypothetical protein